MLMLDVRLSYFSFKDVLPVNHAECFCCHFQYLVYFYSQFILQIFIECLPFIKYCTDQGYKTPYGPYCPELRRLPVPFKIE